MFNQWYGSMRVSPNITILCGIVSAIGGLGIKLHAEIKPKTATAKRNLKRFFIISIRDVSVTKIKQKLCFMYYLPNIDVIFE
jgi:hypothetical protein